MGNIIDSNHMSVEACYIQNEFVLLHYGTMQPWLNSNNNQFRVSKKRHHNIKMEKIMRNDRTILIHDKVTTFTKIEVVQLEEGM